MPDFKALGPKTLEVTHLIRIPLSEFELTFVRSSGPGGQNVNKVNSKAVLRWNFASSPSVGPDVKHRFVASFGSRLTREGELVIMSDRFRDQRRNQDDCLEKLAELLRAVATPPKARKKTKPSRSSVRRAREEKTRHSEKKTQRRAF